VQNVFGVRRGLRGLFGNTRDGGLILDLKKQKAFAYSWFFCCYNLIPHSLELLFHIIASISLR
jgi:hypothetical protein